MCIKRLLRKSAAIIFAFALSFITIPTLSGSLSVNADSYPGIGYTQGDIRGGIGGFYYHATSGDSDSPNTSVRVDVYLDNTKVATHQTGQYGVFSGFAKTTNYGTHDVKFVVYDLDSSGIQTGKTFTYSDHPVTIYTVDDFVSSDIDIYTANCQYISGRVPLSRGTTVYISNSPDSGFKYLTVDPKSDYGTFYTDNKSFLSGTVYLKCTASDGTSSKTILKEVEVEDHTYDAGKITVPAKYFSVGKKVFTCTRCEATKTVTLPKKNIAAVTPAKAKITSAKVKGKKLTLKWKRIVKNTKGYQIGLKDKKSGMTRYVNVKQGSKATVTKVVKKLEKGRKYAIRVRAYNIVEGQKVYGAWSKAKVGKV